MRNKTSQYQKTTTLQVTPFARSIIQKEAIATGQTGSNIVDSLIISHYLPTVFTDIAISLYTDSIDIQEALIQIWIEAASMRYDCIDGVVKFAWEATIQTYDNPSLLTPELPHLLSLLGSLSANIKDRRYASSIADLRSQYENGFGPINSCCIYAILLKNWVDIKSYVTTYNLLQCLATIQPGWEAISFTYRDLIDKLWTVKWTDHKP